MHAWMYMIGTYILAALDHHFFPLEALTEMKWALGFQSQYYQQVIHVSPDSKLITKENQTPWLFKKWFLFLKLSFLSVLFVCLFFCLYTVHCTHLLHSSFEVEHTRWWLKEVKRRAFGLRHWESHFHVGIWFRFWTLSLIGFLNSYPGTTMNIWYNDFYRLSTCMHGSEVDNMEVRLSTAEVRSPSLCFGVFLCVCVPPSLRVGASGTRVHYDWTFHQSVIINEPLMPFLLWFIIISTKRFIIDKEFLVYTSNLRIWFHLLSICGQICELLQLSKNSLKFKKNTLRTLSES